MTKWIVLAVALIGTPAWAEMGGEAGGGGKGVVCRDAGGAVKSVQLLDLWEAKALYSRAALPVTGSLARTVDEELVRLKNSYRYDGTGWISGHDFPGQDYILETLREKARFFLSPSPGKVKRLHGVTLALTDDSFEVARPENCNVEQLVNYQDNGSIYVNQDLWEKMDKTNLAALIAHEAFYALLREFSHEQNSIRARRSVGLVASGYVFPAIAYNLPATYTYCEYRDPRPVHAVQDQIQFAVTEKADHSWVLNIFAGYVNYSPLLSASVESIELSPDFAEPIITGKCPKDGGLYFPFQAASKSLVEFDRDISVGWNCDQGKLDIILIERPTGEKQPLEHVMSCQFGALAAQ